MAHVGEDPPFGDTVAFGLGYPNDRFLPLYCRHDMRPGRLPDNGYVTPGTGYLLNVDLVLWVVGELAPESLLRHISPYLWDAFVGYHGESLRHQRYQAFHVMPVDALHKRESYSFGIRYFHVFSPLCSGF